MKRLTMLLVAGILLVPVSETDALAITYADSFAYPVTPVGSGDRKQNPLLDGWTGYGVGATGADCGHLAQDYYLSVNPSNTVGKPVYAAANGIVFEVVDNDNNQYGWCDSGSHGWGRVIVIKHTAPPGTAFSTAGAIVSLNYVTGDPRYPGSTAQNPTVVYTLYGHVGNDVRVSKGQEVTKGQLVGFIGSTSEQPWSQPHVHFEIKSQAAVDAGVWIKNNCVSASLSASQRCGVQGVGSGYSYITNYAPDHYRPSNFIADNITPEFHCNYVNQWVNGVDINEATGTPGTTFTLAVGYKNTGTATWNNSGGPGDQNYVELRSVTYPGGATTDSWFDPVGWISGRQRVVSSTPASVATNGTATFTFQAQIQAGMAVGDYPVYFRPFHGTTGMDDWGGLYWLVHVTGPGGLCPGREIPNNCVPSTQCYPASATNLQNLPDLKAAQWQSVGQLVRGILQPGKTYSIGLEYRSVAATEVKLGFGTINPTSDLGFIINASTLPASTNNEWRTFWSAPFMVTVEQLRDFSSLRFIRPGNPDDGLEFRNVRILAQ